MNQQLTDDCTADAVRLLERLIATPSVSRDEKRAADVMEEYIGRMAESALAGTVCRRSGNNVWAVAPGYDEQKPTLLLNAHIDTVKPVATWSRAPFTPTVEGDRLYGLGSNDCGGGLVALLQAFRIMAARPRLYNLIYLASAEEEVSGAGGVCSVLPMLPPVWAAIVGEPTDMQPAIAEKGLMVIDCCAQGVSGHAARGEGVNAIYEALDDLLWLRSYRFGRVSELLGPTTLSVTVVNAGTQHNVVPDKCEFVVDVRTNELYTNQEVFSIVSSHLKSAAKARSFRLGSSRIAPGHPIVRRCLQMGMTPFGSPTLSDQALMPFPSLKLGPGLSARSHSADEYICTGEISEAISKYINLLDGLQPD